MFQNNKSIPKNCTIDEAIHSIIITHRSQFGLWICFEVNSLESDKIKWQTALIDSKIISNNINLITFQLKRIQYKICPTNNENVLQPSREITTTRLHLESTKINQFDNHSWSNDKQFPNWLSIGRPYIDQMHSYSRVVVQAAWKTNAMIINKTIDLGAQTLMRLWSDYQLNIPCAYIT